MRSRAHPFLGITLILAGVAVGCGDGKAPVKTYTMAKAADPLEEVRALLTRYAAGQPVGSEVTSYDDLVARVRAQDIDRADAVDEGLKAIAANPRAAGSEARRLLTKIGPAAPGP